MRRIGRQAVGAAVGPGHAGSGGIKLLVALMVSAACCVDMAGASAALRHPALFGSAAVGGGQGAGAIRPAPVVPDFEDGDDASIKVHWALLVAGSSGWGNYRHQADVFHSYQVVRSGGLQPRHIVVMAYDDIAQDPQNPFPGQIFNSPGGPDVRAGVPVDYSGPDVNAHTFLAVLEGNKSAVARTGSGRVIASGPRDRVFVFYSDHGAPGVLGMPSGSFLYADELVHALARKHRKRGYREAVLYIEACESGSMFEGLLSNEIGVYATTASNAFESSWGTYCPGMSPDVSPSFTTCLGDLYSVAWMENAEAGDLTKETLGQQYKVVKRRTSNNGSYDMGSHVMQYGELSIQQEAAGDYEGMLHRGSAPQPLPQPPTSSSFLAALAGLVSGLRARLGMGMGLQAAPAHSKRQQQQQQLGRRPGGALPGLGGALPQAEADLVHLRATAAHGRTQQARTHAQSALDQELARRSRIDGAAAAAVQQLLMQPSSALQLAAHLGLASRAELYALPSSAPGSSAFQSASNALQPAAAHVSALLHSPMGRPAPGRPLVDDWACLRGMVAAWEAACGGPLCQYAMRHTRLMANLCNAGVQPRALQQALSAGGCQQLGPARQQ